MIRDRPNSLGINPNQTEGEAGSTVGTTASAVDLTVITNHRLYDENGVSDTDPTDGPDPS